MSGWDSILREIHESESAHDGIRRKYIKELSNYTGRNTIVYYSGWLSKPGENKTDINDADLQGFMNALNGMNFGKGLDLLLHTPGGDPAAAEAIVSYLRKKFGKDIRAIIPQQAMSAGTMIACACKTIVMGNHSYLGPIDPQFAGIPAHNIEKEFVEAKEDLSKHPENAHYWAIKLQQYPAAFMKSALDAIDLADILVKEWLGTCMFDKKNKKDETKINRIVEKLNNHADSKVHSRHFDIDFCKELGLTIEKLEDDDNMQNAVLNVHHASMLTLDGTSAVKIIENQNDKCMVLTVKN